MKSSFKKSTQNRRIYGWLQAGIRTTVAVKSENGGVQWQHACGTDHPQNWFVLFFVHR